MKVLYHIYFCCTLLLRNYFATCVDAAEVNWMNRGVSSSALPFSSSSPLLTNQVRVPLTAVKVSPDGHIYNTKVLKQQLANELSLPLRDLRVVDPSLPTQIQATFTARPKAILFCIENIKVVVQSNEALIFSPNRSEVQDFLPLLLQNIQQNQIGIDQKQKMRFEHVVLETALNVVCSSLFNRVRELSPQVKSVLNGLRAETRGLDVVQTQVDHLLPLKNNIDELRKRVKEIKRAITDVLNSDEDMSMMFLSPLPKQTAFVGVTVPNSFNFSTMTNTDPDFTMVKELTATTTSTNPISSQDISSARTDILVIEDLFETYLNEIEWISAELEEFLDEIINTEENVVLQLDILRNRILRFELNLSMLSFVASIGAVVSGMFGMNLVNHLEKFSMSFYIVTVITGVACSSLFMILRKIATLRKIF